MRLRDAVQELHELGLRGAASRSSWEVRTRVSRFLPHRESPPSLKLDGLSCEWASHLPFEDPITLARWMRPLISTDQLLALRQMADESAHGRIQCFSRWPADFGEPIRWHRNPATGLEWNANTPGIEVLSDQSPGDVKYCWEIGRFPHAYHLARSAAFFPENAERYAAILAQQIAAFIEANPIGYGVHWSSGQEIGFRLLAWLFALDVLLMRTKAGVDAASMVRDALVAGANQIERHLDYARIAVYNNHLLSEALALFGVGALLPEAPRGRKWRELGRKLLDQQAEAQFYDDGAYIQQSHNYHRVALKDYLWACIFARAMGDSPSVGWIRALERSLDFLYAHQNPTDGRLPNYGANDGALPSPLTTCDFSDMRPVLQTVSLLVRGERLYAEGPWDETAAWFLGVRALVAPLRAKSRRSVAFESTGYYVLRGQDQSTFAAFRCGTLRDRFSQIDMLHLDVWWRGLNVLVDAGSYLYNDRPEWHNHFMRTSCHNTVVIDRRDQMLHFRQFKVLYRTQARLLCFDDNTDWAICAGEHHGYSRHAGKCVHSRSVLFVKDDLWVVVDHIAGKGSHAMRIHWLCGDFPYSYDANSGQVILSTVAGDFFVQVLDAGGQPVSGDVVAGQEDPPRGWLSRYYGEKIAVPSLAVEGDQVLPATFISVLSGGRRPDLRVSGERWTIGCGDKHLGFRIVDGSLSDICMS